MLVIAALPVVVFQAATTEQFGGLIGSEEDLNEQLPSIDDDTTAEQPSKLWSTMPKIKQEKWKQDFVRVRSSSML